MSKHAFLTEIPATEIKFFDAFIHRTRREFIPSPKETVKQVLAEHDELMNAFATDHQASLVIKTLREEAFSSFLVAEAKMNAHILKNISEQFSVPKEKFNALCGIFEHSNEKMEERLRDFFGEYAGQIYPYIYRLSLSNT